MPVRMQKTTLGVLVDRWADCSAWDALPSPGKDGWTLITLDCQGEIPRSRRPWAESLSYSPNASVTGVGGGLAAIQATSPLTAVTSGGIATISINLILALKETIAALKAAGNEYVSDEDAVLDGLVSGDPYVAATGHYSLKPGTLTSVE